jgi:hypothetical protein
MRALIFSSACCLLLGTAAAATGPEPQLVPGAVFTAISQEYSGEGAREYTRRIVEYHRIQGSPMMAEVAERVVLAELTRLGIESRIEKFPSDGKISYQTWLSPMGWDMRAGELWVESAGGTEGFVPERLCRYADVPMCVSTYPSPASGRASWWRWGRGPRPRTTRGRTCAARSRSPPATPPTWSAKPCSSTVPWGS